MKKLLIIYFLIIILFSLSGYYAFRQWIILEPPVVTNAVLPAGEVEQKNDSLRVWGDNWLHLNDHGQYELYIQGSPYERGVVAGKLGTELLSFQEKAFMDRISELVPSMGYQRFLRLLIALFNKNIDQSIPLEYLQEIYGISRSASADYDFVGPAYDRMLQYHGAHDIGHMLQNYSLVGCSSFAVWNEKSADSTLLVGRNFDFFVGEAFAEKKIIEFCKPDSGYGFMMVTWGGMCGSVSGMNERGLTVTINAAKSVIPSSAADPVSLIAREILQYASNINEAYSIANMRSCFVSESYLIGSASDNRAVVIEKTPYAIALYEGGMNQILCTNHFQSQTFAVDSVNVKHIQRSASLPRYLRMEELLRNYGAISVKDAASVLRDQQGLGNTDIGLGNEKVMNQLIAHHSIIFKPMQQIVWVSTSPYQLGAYVAYDLRAILAKPKMMLEQKQIYKKALTLQADTFLQASAWQHYLEFQKTTKRIVAGKGRAEEGITEEVLDNYLALNALFFYGYEVCGDYCFNAGQYQKALEYFQQSLSKDIPTVDERERIEGKLAECQKKMKK